MCSTGRAQRCIAWGSPQHGHETVYVSVDTRLIRLLPQRPLGLPPHCHHARVQPQALLPRSAASVRLCLVPHPPPPPVQGLLISPPRQQLPDELRLQQRAVAPVVDAHPGASARALAWLADGDQTSGGTHRLGSSTCAPPQCRGCQPVGCCPERMRRRGAPTGGMGH